MSTSGLNLSGSTDYSDFDGGVSDDEIEGPDPIEAMFENSKIGVPLNAKYDIEEKFRGRLMADYLEKMKARYPDLTDVDEIPEMKLLGQIFSAKKVRDPAAANQKGLVDDPRMKQVIAWADPIFKGLASWRDKPEDRVKTLLAIRRGVRYITQADKRSKYLITVAGNLQRGGVSFDTKALRSLYSKKGDYLLGEVIWVMDEGENFYSHIAKIGRMHHSSFFAGGKIRAGGDWVVENGKIKSISGRSGHYKPDMSHFLGALRALEGNGAFQSDDKVLMVWNSWGYDKKMEMISFSDLKSNPDLYTVYDPNAA